MSIYNEWKKVMIDDAGGEPLHSLECHQEAYENDELTETVDSEVALRSELHNAVLLLVRLGYSFASIVEKCYVKKSFLLQVFAELGLQVPTEEEYNKITECNESSLTNVHGLMKDDEQDQVKLPNSNLTDKLVRSIQHDIEELERNYQAAAVDEQTKKKLLDLRSFINSRLDNIIESFSY